MIWSEDRGKAGLILIKEKKINVLARLLLLRPFIQMCWWPSTKTDVLSLRPIAASEPVRFNWTHLFSNSWISDLSPLKSCYHLLVLSLSVQVLRVSMSVPSSASLLPVLHACLIGHTLLQGKAVHLQEVFHVLNLNGKSLFPESLQLSLVMGPGRRLIKPLVRVVSVDSTADALAVCHRQHLAAAAAAAALPNTAWRCRFGNL